MTFRFTNDVLETVGNLSMRHTKLVEHSRIGSDPRGKRFVVTEKPRPAEARIAHSPLDRFDLARRELI